MTKSRMIGSMNVREQKAAALDDLVKKELTRQQGLQSAKMTRLKALRLAREAEEPVVSPPKTQRAAPRRQIHR